MAKKKCANCKTTKSLNQFNYKNKVRKRRQARCKICTRKDVMSAYYKNRKYYIAYRLKRNKMLRKKIGRFVHEYLLDHPCIDCGNKDPRVLHFDHVRGQKKYNVSELKTYGSGIESIKNEMKKCEVRCANCHAITTANQFNYYKYLD